METKRNRKKAVADTEVLPPEKDGGGMQVRIDAAHLRVLTRAALLPLVEVVMPDVLAALARDASLGVWDTVVSLDDLEEWRAVPMLEEIANRLEALGCMVKAGRKERSYGQASPALVVSWKGGLRD